MWLRKIVSAQKFRTPGKSPSVRKLKNPKKRKIEKRNELISSVALLS